MGVDEDRQVVWGMGVDDPPADWGMGVDDPPFYDCGKRNKINHIKFILTVMQL